MLSLAKDFIVPTFLHKGGSDWGYSYNLSERSEVMLHNLVELQATTSPFNSDTQYYQTDSTLPSSYVFTVKMNIKKRGWVQITSNLRSSVNPRYKRNWSSDGTPNVGRKRTLQAVKGKHSMMARIRRRKP